jgi:hypothetical protein
MKALKRMQIIIAVALILFMFGTSAMAFNPITARSMAMGNTHAVTLRGVETIGINPAFMAFSDNPSFSMYSPLVNLGFNFSNDFFGLDKIDKYFQKNLHLDDALKTEFLSEFDGDEWDIYTDFYIPVFAISFPTRYLSIGLSMDTGISTDTWLSKEFFNFALNGNPIEDFGITHDFGNTGERMQWSSRLGLTIAKRFDDTFDITWLDELTTGFTFTYYIGHAFSETVQATGTFLTNSAANAGTEEHVMEGHGIIEIVNGGIKLGNDTEGDIEFGGGAMSFASGSGVGLDFGLGAKILKGKGIVGLSFINIMNTINWTGAQRRYYSFDIENPPTFSGMNNPEKWVEENFTLVDSLSQDDEDITSHVPSSFNMTGGYFLTEDLLVASDMRFALNDCPGQRKGARFGAGLEYSGLKVLPLRMGFSNGSRSGFTFGMGFGLHTGFWRTDIGWSWERGIASTANGMRFAWNTVWFFGRK